MRKWLENLMHFPICANCWIPDSASTGLNHEYIQTQQWIEEIAEREQSFLPKPGFSAISLLCQTTYEIFTDTSILFLPLLYFRLAHVSLETWKSWVS